VQGGSQPLDDDLLKRGIDLAAEPAPPERLAGDEGGARPGERIDHERSGTASRGDEPAHQLERLLRRMRGLLAHAVGQGGYLEHVARLGAEWIRLPDVGLAAITRALSLWMRGIAQRMGVVRDPSGVDVEGEVGTPQVEEALVRPTPVAPKVRFVTVVPDEPAAAGEVRSGDALDV